MTTFLIVLIVILVIFCGVMLYLYFSVRKEADNYEHDVERYSRLYEDCQEIYRAKYKEWSDARYRVFQLERELSENKSRIRQLEASFNDHTISIRSFGPHLNYFSGSIDIPVELRSPETDFDPFDEPLIEQDIQTKLVRILGKEALKHTGFRMEYDMSSHVYSMIYILPMCVENKYVDSSEYFYLNQESEKPMLDMIQKLFKGEEQE